MRTTLNGIVNQIAAQYRDAYRKNLHHLVDGGVLDDGQMLACYVDYSVSDYLLGSGPTTITVVYDDIAKTRSYDLYKKAHAAGRYGDDALLSESAYAARDAATAAAAKKSINGAVTGRTSVVFLAPMAAHSSIAVEAWQAIAQWDVQTVNGVETAVRYGTGPNDAEYSQPLAGFKARVTTAAASDAHAGKRIANANGLNRYYRDIGAYDDITPEDGSGATFAPSQPPAALDCGNGVAVASPQLNPGLAADCRALAALRDTLDRGRKLNWDDDRSIGSWDGITVSGGRVTRLELAGKGLTGTVPAELGDLSALQYLDLGENSLTEGLPVSLSRLTNLQYLYLNDNDLSGGIPAEYAALRLQYLDDFPGLQDLDLTGNRLTGKVELSLYRTGGSVLTISHLAGLDPLEEYTGNPALAWTPITRALSEGGGTQTVTVIAELDPGSAMANFYAREEDSVQLTVAVSGSDGGGVVGFTPVESFPLVVELQGGWGWADFDVAPVDNGVAEADETITVSAAGKGALGSADLAITSSNKATLTLKDTTPANVNPRFPATAATRAVAENTASGTGFDARVSAGRPGGWPPAVRAVGPGRGGVHHRGAQRAAESERGAGLRGGEQQEPLHGVGDGERRAG